jgi:hypothetical protein
LAKNCYWLTDWSRWHELDERLINNGFVRLGVSNWEADNAYGGGMPQRQLAVAYAQAIGASMVIYSFIEVQRRGDTRYLQWAYEVLDHSLACLEVSGEPRVNARALAVIDSVSFNYLGAGDRALIKDALTFGCDAFLTMENKLPKVAAHIHKVLGIRVFSPIEMWEILRPWAALFW